MTGLKEIFVHLKFEKFKFNILPETPIIFPEFKGQTLRGALGHTLKRIVCLKKNNCSECILQKNCVYSYIFESPNFLEESFLLSSKSAIPHPFVLEPPLEKKKEYSKDELFSFSLILIGKALDFLPYIIFTISEMGKRGLGKTRGKFRIESVSISKDGKEITIFEGSSQTLKGFHEEVGKTNSYMEKECNFLTLNFITPVRIVEGGKPVKDLKFHQVIKSLLFRSLQLCYFHCGKKIELEINPLVEESKSVKVKDSSLRWFDWSHYSPRAKEKIKLGGLIGKISFSGEMGKWLPLIELGEILHIGKGTSFGLGKYEILKRS